VALLAVEDWYHHVVSVGHEHLCLRTLLFHRLWVVHALLSTAQHIVRRVLELRRLVNCCRYLAPLLVLGRYVFLLARRRLIAIVSIHVKGCKHALSHSCTEISICVCILMGNCERGTDLWLATKGAQAARISRLLLLISLVYVMLAYCWSYASSSALHHHIVVKIEAIVETCRHVSMCEVRASEAQIYCLYACVVLHWRLLRETNSLLFACHLLLHQLLRWMSEG